MARLLELQMVRVDSSAIIGFGFEYLTGGDLYGTGILTIEFESNSVYQYYGVSMQEFLDLLDSPSPGTSFYVNIKNVYPFERLN